MRLGLLTVLAVAFVVLSCWYAGAFGQSPAPDRVWIGWIGVIFAGASAIFLLVRLIEGGNLIVVDETGIWWRYWSALPIPWSAIAAIGIQEFQRQTFVCVTLHDRHQNPATRLVGRLTSLNRWFGFGDVTLNTTGTDTTPTKLYEAIRRHCTR